MKRLAMLFSLIAILSGVEQLFLSDNMIRIVHVSTSIKRGLASLRLLMTSLNLRSSRLIGPFS